MQVGGKSSVVREQRRSLLRVIAIDGAENPAPRGESGRTWLWLLAAAAALIAGAMAAFNVDCIVAQWFFQGRGPRYLHDLATISELFGRGECVLLVTILIWRLDRARLWALPGLAATALLSGLAADAVKMLIARVRPHHFDILKGVWDAVSGRVAAIGIARQPGNQSFPSAHTATAMGLAISLMVIYPAEARWLFCLGAAIGRLPAPHGQRARISSARTSSAARSRGLRRRRYYLARPVVRSAVQRTVLGTHWTVRPASANLNLRCGRRA